jgi:hypothetical protein
MKLSDEERIWRDMMPPPGYKLTPGEYIRVLDNAVRRAKAGMHLDPMPHRDDLN